MGGYLTTHVLDITRGCPAAGMRIEVWRFDSAKDGKRKLLKQLQTNAEGRTDQPLLKEQEFSSGIYELVFAVGAYFSAQGHSGEQFPFLDAVPVRFGVADSGTHYHVPLLASPWAYSTYRGS